MAVRVGGRKKDLERAMRGKEASFCTDELLTITSGTGLSGRQTEKLLAGMRLKLGRGFVESHMRDKIVEHNNQYNEYFTGKFEVFQDKDGMEITQPLVYCSQVVEFLEKVEENRGVLGRGKKRKLGGDSGMCKQLFERHCFSDAFLDQGKGF